jgi:hypothetical protein
MKRQGQDGTPSATLRLAASLYPDDDDWDENADCSMCGGDGYEECYDPIQCLRRHFGGSPFDGGEHECSACGGSGKAKDQTAW